MAKNKRYDKNSPTALEFKREFIEGSVDEHGNPQWHSMNHLLSLSQYSILKPKQTTIQKQALREGWKGMKQEFKEARHQAIVAKVIECREIILEDGSEFVSILSKKLKQAMRNVEDIDMTKATPREVKDLVQIYDILLKNTNLMNDKPTDIIQLEGEYDEEFKSFLASLYGPSKQGNHWTEPLTEDDLKKLDEAGEDTPAISDVAGDGSSQAES